MKRVLLKNMTLINFKGHKKLEIEFGQKTNVNGDNGTGKSSIFDAFTWLLHGKDQFDRKDFEIIPTINNEMLEKVDVEVCAMLNFETRDIELKRVFHQKWVRKRGSETETYTGNETRYYINNVPKRASEYKAYVDTMLEETVFKLITNPSTFLNLHWTKQREFLFQIAGTISDLEIAEKEERFANLIEMLNGKSLIDYKKELAARKNKLKVDLDNIQPRIDQTEKLKPEIIDIAEIEGEINMIDIQIKSIDEQILSKSKAYDVQFENNSLKRVKISKLEREQSDILSKAKLKEQNRIHSENQGINELKNSVNSTLESLNSAKEDLTKQQKKLSESREEREKVSKKREIVGEQWRRENATEYKTNAGCLKCPAFGHECKDEIAIKKHAENSETAKENFDNEKIKNISEIIKRGNDAKTELAEIDKKIIVILDIISAIEINHKNFSDEYSTLSSELSNKKEAKVIEVKGVNLPEWANIEKEKTTIKESISDKITIPENSELINKKTELTKSIEPLNAQLESQKLITKYDNIIQELKDKGANLAQQIANVEKSEFTIADFTRIKISESENRINALFSLVKFKLFDYTNDGSEFESCIATNLTGVPISATNTAERVNAGLDIIKRFIEFFNISAPVFIDDANLVNDFVELDTQIIELEVTKEPLKIEINE